MNSMLHINAIKAIINSESGIFEGQIAFQRGLNIVRANNTSGKSSIFGALLFGLGFEELLGGRNDKALQSVFKSTVKEIVGPDKEEIEYTVLQSDIFLEFSNGESTITTRRFGRNDKVKTQAVEVILGPAISNPNGDYERKGMYVHDAGAASNEELGFHAFLEEFLQVKLPEVINQDGKRVKLYFPLIAAAHFIEQKAGWSDYFNNMPFYGIRDSAGKVFEYILGFEVFGIAANRQEILNNLREVTEEWKLQVDKIKAIANKGGGDVVGIPDQPEILSKAVKPYFRLFRGDRHFLLEELIKERSQELSELQNDINTPLNINLNKLQNSLNSSKELVEKYEVLYESVNSDAAQDRETYRQYSAQLKSVDEDIKKNKNAEKLEKLGLDANLKISKGYCPACNQVIEDSLLSEHVHAIPMRIDENLEYLEAQRKMILAFLNNLQEEYNEKVSKINSIEDAIAEGRRKIRSLRRDLIADDRLPSQELIERKVILEREVSFLYKTRIEFEEAIQQLYLISNKFEVVKGRQSKLPKEYLSQSDSNKLLSFENIYKKLLFNFGYSTRPVQLIRISPDNYLPGYEVKLENSASKYVDIRFESSASDFIRSQWAYYTALCQSSLENGGNHFGVLVFDEPQQQSASTVNFRSFLNELEGMSKNQIIIFASFQNSDKDFQDATRDLKRTKVFDFAKTNNMVIRRKLE
ncbi:MAG: hypothetical protein J0G98_10925 [Terrimonas ferruginea]|uniref:hypothetical protein n=1 Tax=Terrimonas ferruginea TaxID=249 RepID=UPI00092ABC22|nr:hypothetical protein [Terrimonas ferruginea]MBN8783568.1 hypothetical protein [Terrimonas ferruginea]OJW40320.1 MAG: hypothetical protein BGO56_09740 [Sphingobacteriales bacterium 48-107]